MNKTERLLAKTRLPDGCWLWIGNTSKEGYGRLRTGPRSGSRVQLAHRVMWEAIHGPIIGDLDVLHHCDTPACVRPDHLYLGTQADNNRDRTVRERGRSRLNSAQVRLIRSAHAEGWTLTALAAQFGVAVPTIHDVVHHVSWKHVD